MENAVKALLMAAGVLIGVMTITIGVSLYSSLGGYVESIQEDIASNEIRKFNEQYTKYIDAELTIHDIVTAANTARENNLNGGYYVTIKLGNKNLENIISSESTEILENGLGIQYKCTSGDVKFNEETGRVCEVKFSKKNWKKREKSWKKEQNVL